MSGERKIFSSKRKYGSIPFDLDTDDGIKSYFIIKMTCSQVSEWMNYCGVNSDEVVKNGKTVYVPKTIVNWKETLLSYSVVDQNYDPLPITHFNQWTEEAVSSVYQLADQHNFPTEKKVS